MALSGAPVSRRRSRPLVCCSTSHVLGDDVDGNHEVNSLLVRYADHSSVPRSAWITVFVVIGDRQLVRLSAASAQWSGRPILTFDVAVGQRGAAGHANLASSLFEHVDIVITAQRVGCLGDDLLQVAVARCQAESVPQVISKSLSGTVKPSDLGPPLVRSGETGEQLETPDQPRRKPYDSCVVAARRA